MNDSDRFRHLRLVDHDLGQTEHSHSKVTTQGTLFPLSDTNALFFVDVARASASTFLRLIQRAQPQFVVDIRVTPRFDFGRLNRQRVFDVFQEWRCNYVDLGWRMKVESRKDARWNPVFLAREISELFTNEAALKGPVVLLFDDEQLFHAAVAKLPDGLPRKSKENWTVFVERCDANT